jgi:hypothetical protein
MDATTMAREAADSATEVTNAAKNKPPHQDQKPPHQKQKPSLVATRNRPKHQDKKSSLVLMTWNASCLLSLRRELALLHLLTSSAVHIATVTECELAKTAKDFVVAGYTSFFPMVPKGKSKTQVIILVKNDLVTSANVHLCNDLMDSQTQSIWLRFGPVLSMGGVTLCGVYRHVFNVPEATERLETLSSQILRAAEKYARVIIHGDVNQDLDRSGDPLYARKSLLKAMSECTEAAGLKTHKMTPTWHSYGLHRGSRPRGGGNRPGNGLV